MARLGGRVRRVMWLVWLVLLRVMWLVWPFLRVSRFIPDRVKIHLAPLFEFGCLEISLGMACCNRGFSLIRIAFENEKKKHAVSLRIQGCGLRGNLPFIPAFLLEEDYCWIFLPDLRVRKKSSFKFWGLIDWLFEYITLSSKLLQYPALAMIRVREGCWFLHLNFLEQIRLYVKVQGLGCRSSSSLVIGSENNIL